MKRIPDDPSMHPGDSTVKEEATETSTISCIPPATAEGMTERRSGKPSIPDEMAETVWSHIENVHKRLGSVIRQTARHYGTTPTTVANWLTRTSKPSFGVVVEIAEKDGIQIDRLLFGGTATRSLINIIDSVFQCVPAVNQDDPVAQRNNAKALSDAAKRLGGDPEEHESALQICQTLLKAGRVDNADGWALLLARIEELDIAPALQTSDSELSWRSGIDLSRMRPPPDQIPDEIVEKPAAPLAHLGEKRTVAGTPHPSAKKRTRTR